MNFEQLMESELESVVMEKTINGSVDAFSRTNKFKSVTLPNGDVIVSVSNRDGEVGLINITPGGEVLYKDWNGDIIHREIRTKYGVTKTSLQNYYVPTLINRIMSTDMFDNVYEDYKEFLTEASYEGNIGIMELVKFKQKASAEQNRQLDALIKAGKSKEAWALIQSVTGTKLQGSQFA